MATDNDHNPSRAQRKLLDPSELGTKEYWEAAYTREIQNNSINTADEGVIWFEESNAEEVVLKKLAEYARPRKNLLDPSTCKFLDLGTGNGHMLFALREYENDDDDDDYDDDDDGAEGGGDVPSWQGEMLGVDYSPSSIQLARQIQEQKQTTPPIRFEEYDLLSSNPLPIQGSFEVVHDKGTFDAISLMPHHDGSANQSPLTPPHPCETYREKIAELVRPGYFLFITSCNWTKSELIDWLAPNASSELQFFDDAEYPTFTFGGQTGQSVVTLVFRRG